jgi:hypothetical protein
MPDKNERISRKSISNSLVGKEAELWSKIDQLIATKQPKRYEEAVSLLQDLRDLGELKGGGSAFSSKMVEFDNDSTRVVWPN